MLAEIDHRVGAETVGQPGIGGEIGVRRHQRRVVIGRFRVEIVAARRLDQHRDIAGAEAGDREPAAIEPPRTEERVALGGAPALRHLPAARAGGRLAKKAEYSAKDSVSSAGAWGLALVGPASSRCHQRGAVLGHVAGPVAGLAQRLQDRDRRCRRVEPDPVADAAVPVRVVGEHDRDPPLGRRLGAQPRPVARQIGDKGDPVGDRAIADEIGLGLRVAAERRLERHGARQDAAVDLGQAPRSSPDRAGRGPACSRASSPRRRRKRRSAGPGNRRAADRRRRDADSENPVAFRITAGGCAAKHARPSSAAASSSLRLLTKTGSGRSRARRQRLHQRIDRRRVAGLHERPVEHDRHDPSLAPPPGSDLGEARQSRAPASTARRAAAAPARPIRSAADQARRIAQKIVGIARAAFGQIAPQPSARSGRQGREPRQFGVGLVVAGQQRERDCRYRGRSRPDARHRTANRRCRRAAAR